MIHRVGRRLLRTSHKSIMNLNLNLPNNNTEGLCFCTNKIVTLEKEILEIKEQIK